VIVKIRFHCPLPFEISLWGLLRQTRCLCETTPMICHIRTPFLTAAAVLLSGSAFANDAPLPFAEATFTEVVNDVQVVSRADAKAVKAVKDARFAAPDLVKTGRKSRAQLTGSDGTIARVGSNAVFAFDKSSRTINLESGSVLFHSPTGKGGGTIVTNSATASVIGTTIIVTATSNGGFKMLVLEGVAKVQFPNGQVSTVNAGQMTFVMPGATVENKSDGASGSSSQDGAPAKGGTPGPVLNFDLASLASDSGLITGFATVLPSIGKIHLATGEQGERLADGELKATGLFIVGAHDSEQFVVADPNAVQQSQLLQQTPLSDEVRLNQSLEESLVVDGIAPIPEKNIFRTPVQLPAALLPAGIEDAILQGVAVGNLRHTGTVFDLGFMQGAEHVDVFGLNTLETGTITFQSAPGTTSLRIVGGQVLVSPGSTITANLDGTVTPGTATRFEVIAFTAATFDNVSFKNATGDVLIETLAGNLSLTGGTVSASPTLGLVEITSNQGSLQLVGATVNGGLSSLLHGLTGVTLSGGTTVNASHVDITSDGLVSLTTATVSGTGPNSVHITGNGITITDTSITSPGLVTLDGGVGAISLANSVIHSNGGQLKGGDISLTGHPGTQGADPVPYGEFDAGTGPLDINAAQNLTLSQYFLAKGASVNVTAATLAATDSRIEATTGGMVINTGTLTLTRSALHTSAGLDLHATGKVEILTDSVLKSTTAHVNINGATLRIQGATVQSAQLTALHAAGDLRIDGNSSVTGAGVDIRSDNGRVDLDPSNVTANGTTTPAGISLAANGITLANGVTINAGLGGAKFDARSYDIVVAKAAITGEGVFIKGVNLTFTGVGGSEDSQNNIIWGGQINAGGKPLQIQGSNLALTGYTLMRGASADLSLSGGLTMNLARIESTTGGVAIATGDINLASSDLRSATHIALTAGNVTLASADLHAAAGIDLNVTGKVEILNEAKVESTAAHININGGTVLLRNAIVQSPLNITLHAVGNLRIEGNTGVTGAGIDVRSDNGHIDLDTSNLSATGSGSTLAIAGNGVSTNAMSLYGDVVRLDGRGFAITLNGTSMTGGTLQLSGGSLSATGGSWMATSGAITITSGGAITLPSTRLDAVNGINLTGGTVSLESASDGSEYLVSAGTGVVYVRATNFSATNQTIRGAGIDIAGSGAVSLSNGILQAQGSGQSLPGLSLTGGQVTFANTSLNAGIVTISATSGLTLAGGSINASGAINMTGDSVAFIDYFNPLSSTTFRTSVTGESVSMIATGGPISYSGTPTGGGGITATTGGVELAGVSITLANTLVNAGTFAKFKADATGMVSLSNLSITAASLDIGGRTGTGTGTGTVTLTGSTLNTGTLNLDAATLTLDTVTLNATGPVFIERSPGVLADLISIKNSTVNAHGADAGGTTAQLRASTIALAGVTFSSDALPTLQVTTGLMSSRFDGVLPPDADKANLFNVLLGTTDVMSGNLIWAPEQNLGDPSAPVHILKSGDQDFRGATAKFDYARSADYTENWFNRLPGQLPLSCLFRQNTPALLSNADFGLLDTEVLPPVEAGGGHDALEVKGLLSRNWTFGDVVLNLTLLNPDTNLNESNDRVDIVATNSITVNGSLHLGADSTSHRRIELRARNIVVGPGAGIISQLPYNPDEFGPSSGLLLAAAREVVSNGTAGSPVAIKNPAGDINIGSALGDIVLNHTDIIAGYHDPALDTSQTSLLNSAQEGAVYVAGYAPGKKIQVVGGSIQGHSNYGLGVYIGGGTGGIADTVDIRNARIATEARSVSGGEYNYTSDAGPGLTTGISVAAVGDYMATGRVEIQGATLVKLASDAAGQCLLVAADISIKVDNPSSTNISDPTRDAIELDGVKFAMAPSQYIASTQTAPATSTGIAMDAKTITLRNITFPDSVQVRLKSKDGILNIGSQMFGAVNFLQNVGIRTAGSTDTVTDLTTKDGINSKVWVENGSTAIRFQGESIPAGHSLNGVTGTTPGSAPIHIQSGGAPNQQGQHGFPQS
jgi:hypothetical protein